MATVTRERAIIDIQAPPQDAQRSFRAIQEEIRKTGRENKETGADIVKSNQDWRQSLQGIQAGVGLVSSALGAMGAAASTAYGYVTGGMREALRLDENLGRSLRGQNIDLEDNRLAINARADAWLASTEITTREYERSLQQVTRFTRGTSLSLQELQTTAELALAAMADAGEGFDAGIAKAFGEFRATGDVQALAGDLPGLRHELDALAESGASTAEVMEYLSGALAGAQDTQSEALIQTARLEDAVNELEVAFAEAMSTFLVDSGAIEWVKDAIKSLGDDLNDPNSSIRHFTDETLPALASAFVTVAEAAASMIDVISGGGDAVWGIADILTGGMGTAGQQIASQQRTGRGSLQRPPGAPESGGAGEFVRPEWAMGGESALVAALELDDEDAERAPRRHRRRQEEARDILTIGEAYGSMVDRVRELSDLASELGLEGDETKAAFVGSLMASDAVEQKEMIEALIADLESGLDELPGLVSDALGQTFQSIGAFVGGTSDAFSGLWSGIGNEASDFFSDWGSDFLSAAGKLLMEGGEGVLGLFGIGAAFSLLGGLLGGGGSAGSPSGRRSGGASMADTIQAIRPEMTGGSKTIIQQTLSVGAIFSADESARAVAQLAERARAHGEWMR